MKIYEVSDHCDTVELFLHKEDALKLINESEKNKKYILSEYNVSESYVRKIRHQDTE